MTQLVAQIANARSMVLSMGGWLVSDRQQMLQRQWDGGGETLRKYWCGLRLTS
jgi:hypothetical protein